MARLKPLLSGREGEGSSLPLSSPVPPEASAGRKWRFRRNLVIYLSHTRNGLSQRLLADVFDLPRSRIGAIIREFRTYEEARACGRAFED